MINVKLAYGVEKIGRKLLEDCPQNDCVIYRNVFDRYNEMIEDLKRMETAGCGESSILAVERTILSDMMKLNEMYFNNYAIQSYKKSVKS